MGTWATQFASCDVEAGVEEEYWDESQEPLLPFKIFNRKAPATACNHEVQKESARARLPKSKQEHLQQAANVRKLQAGEDSEEEEESSDSDQMGQEGPSEGAQDGQSDANSEEARPRRHRFQRLRRQRFRRPAVRPMLAWQAVPGTGARHHRTRAARPQDPCRHHRAPFSVHTYDTELTNTLDPQRDV
jgi:hypothetical protein